MSTKDVDAPLRGVRVIEIGQVISAPYAGLLLADLGADVIKVEPPGTGDSARHPEVSGFRGKSATFLTFNRNKRSVCLDLTDADDYNLFAELVAGADVLLTNTVPSTARKLRIDPESVREFNPALITCRVIAFRSDLPQVNEPSFDLTHQALAGYLTLGGHDNDDPSRLPIPIADLSVAMFSSYAILAALYNRERTGLGEDIDVPMFDTLLSLLTYHGMLYLSEGEVPPRIGSAHPHTAPWQSFNTSDGALVVAVRNNKFWRRLCEGIGRAELADDPRFVTNADRIENLTALQAELAEVFTAQATDEWLDQLRRTGVPAARVRSIAEALDAERAAGSPLVQGFRDPGIGEVGLVGNPVRFRRMRMATPSPSPDLDENHAEIESELRAGRPDEVARP